MHERILWQAAALAALVVSIVFSTAANAAGQSDLNDARKRALDANFERVLKENKGPYTQNFCVCRDGKRKPVQLPDGSIVSPCGGSARFCAAWREPWAEALAAEGMYVGNLFARDLFIWDEYEDHHDLVRGYVLEKFFIDTHPDHKLAKMRAYGGLAGAEFEARDAPLFFEKYLSLDEFDEPRHFLLAYELQRRFFVRDDQGTITKARNLASAIQHQQRSFKPLRDAVHNQISAAHIPRIEAYRDAQQPGAVRDQCDELIEEIRKLTTLDEDALRAQLGAFDDTALGQLLAASLPAVGAAPIESIRALAELMGTVRRKVEAKEHSAADRRRLVDLAITAAAVIQQRGMVVVDGSVALTARQHVELLVALTTRPTAVAC